MVDPRLLDALPLTGGLARAARDALAARATVRRFAPGETLWRAGDRPQGLLLVLEGRVRVVSAPEGRPFVVHTEGPGGTLGEVPLFAGGGYPAEAVADGEVRCLAVGREALAAAIAADPALAFALLERLARRVRGLIGRLDGWAARSVRERLAAFLLERAALSGGPTFTLGGSQERVAEEVGTVREVVVRELARLRAEGVVRGAGPRRYAVADPARLRAVADGHEPPARPGG